MSDPLLVRCREIIAEAGLSIMEYLSEYANSTIDTIKMQENINDVIAHMIFQVSREEQKAIRRDSRKKKKDALRKRTARKNP